MAEKIKIVTTTERLLADVADSLRKLAGRPRLVFTAVDVAIPEDEKPPASTAAKPPVTPPAASPPKTEPPKAARPSSAAPKAAK